MAEAKYFYMLDVPRGVGVGRCAKSAFLVGYPASSDCLFIYGFYKSREQETERINMNKAKK